MSETIEIKEPQSQPGPETAPEGTAVPEENRQGRISGGVLWLANTVVIVMFVITFLVQAFQIPSESMEKTLLIGDYLLVDKVHYAHPGFWGDLLPYTQIKHGDIIVFRYPVKPSQFFVKRVIGLPGDHIRLKDKLVYLNGHPLDEPYAVHIRRNYEGFRDNFPNFGGTSADVDTRWIVQMQDAVKAGELVVPAGRYFVMGDNRDDSLDSRYWGFVPRENIVGQPLLIYWSVDVPPARQDDPETASGKLWSFLGSIGRFFTDTRWDRTLHLVK